jgi:type IV pilus assembly protein PilQ
MQKTEAGEEEVLTPDTTVKKKLSQNINIVKKGDKYSIELRNADLGDVIRFFAYKYNLNIIADKDVEGTVTASLSNISIKEALKQILDSQGYTMTEVDNVIRVKKKPPPTKHFKLKNISVNDIKDSLASLLSAHGKLILDENSNSIMVTDDEDHIRLVEKFINNVDVKGKQVFIEAKFLETTVGNVENLGIEWNIVASATGAKRPHTFPFRKTGDKSFYPDVGTEEGFSSKTGWPVLTEGYDTGDSDTTTTFWTLGTLDFSETQAVLRALLTDSNTKIISNPQVAAINNQKAEISISTEYPLPTYEINSDTGELTVSGYEYKDIGIVLNVTPLITEDDYITMDIEPEVGTITDSVEGGVVDLPIISSKKASTKVTIKDGQTIVIGGLISEDDSNTIKKVPLLGSVPLLGQLFTYKSKSNEKRELLIFVTPHIISPEGERKAEKKEKQRKISQLYKQVKELQDEGNYEEALLKLEEILNLEPNEERAKRMLTEVEEKIAEKKRREKIEKELAEARDLYQQGEYEQAQFLIQQILKEDNTNLEAQKYKDLIEKKLQEIKEAKALWQEGSDLLFNQGKYEEARNKFLKYKLLRPEDKEVDRLINLCEQKIEEEKKRKHIRQLLNEGKLYFQSQDYKLAQQVFEKVLNLEPDNELANKYIYEIERIEQEKKKEEAKRREITELYKIAEQQLADNNYIQASSTLEKILNLEPQEKRAKQMLTEVKERIAEKKRREKIEKELAEARDLYQQGEYEQAERLFNSILHQDASNIEAQKYLQLIKKKREEEALVENLWKEVNNLMRANKYQEARDRLLKLKKLRVEDKKIDKMIKICERKIELQRNKYIKELINRGKKYYREKKYDSAHKIFNEVLGLAPENRIARQYVSKIEKIIREKQTREQQEQLRKIIAEKKEKASQKEFVSDKVREKIDALLEEAYSAYQHGKLDYAWSVYNLVLQVDPENEVAKQYIEKIIEAKKASSVTPGIKTEENHIARRPEEGVEVPRKAEELFKAGVQKFKQKDYQAAIEFFEKVLLEEPDNEEAYRYLEKCHQELMKIKEKEKNEKISSLIDEGRGFIRDGQYEQAFESFYNVLEIDPGNKTAQRYLKYLEDKVGRIKSRQAQDIISQLARKQNQWISAELERADIYIQEGNYQQAKKILENILNIKKSDRALELLNKIEIEQKKQLKKAEQQKPESQVVYEGKSKKEKMAEMKKLYGEGIKLYKRGEYKAALEKFTQILNSGLDYKRNRIEKLSAICLEKLQEAKRDELVERKYQLALRYFDMALYDQAMKLLLEVIDIKPNYKEANKYLKMATKRMDILEKLGEYEQSEVEVQN